MAGQKHSRGLINIGRDSEIPASGIHVLLIYVFTFKCLNLNVLYFVAIFKHPVQLKGVRIPVPLVVTVRNDEASAGGSNDRIVSTDEGLRINGSLLPSSKPLETDKAGRRMWRYSFNHYQLGKSELLHVGCERDIVRWCYFRFWGHVIYFRVASYGIVLIRILHDRMEAARHL